MLSALYKPTDNQDNVSAYDIHVNKLNFDNIRFPTSLSQIRQFERQNKKVSINVYLYKPPIVVDPNDEDAMFAHEAYVNSGALMPEHDIVPCYLSKFNRRKNHVDFLLLKEGAYSQYVWIRRFSALIAHRSKDHNKCYPCPHCCHAYSTLISFNNYFFNIRAI